MSTLEEILGTKPPGEPKGSKMWAENQKQQVDNAPVGSMAWAEQNNTQPVQQKQAEPVQQIVASNGQNTTQTTTASDPVTVINPKSTTAPQTGTKEWSEQNSGKNAPVNGMSMAEIYNLLNPYKAPTAEEIAKEKKRQKTASIISTIGDGLTAMSNIYFTSQYAPNMYDGSSLTQKNQVRYDKLKKERDDNRKEYLRGYINAMKIDQDLAHQKEQDALRRELQKYNAQKDKEEREYKKGHDDQQQRNWEFEQAAKLQHNSDVMNQNQEQFNKKLEEQKRQANQNAGIKREQGRKAAASAARGKQIGFSDGGKNQLSIYENVWKGSMQGVFNAIANELAPEDALKKRSWERQMNKLDTEQKKDDFVKQNWYKSRKATEIMMELSKLDPATMPSHIEEKEEGLGWGSDSESETDW